MLRSGNPEARQCRVPCVSRKSKLEMRRPQTHLLEGLTELGAVFNSYRARLNSDQ